MAAIARRATAGWSENSPKSNLPTPSRAGRFLLNTLPSLAER